jgi:hypothetical protein
MNNDPELQEWSSDWKSDADREYSEAAIRLYAQGRNRFMWTWILLELTIGGIALPILGYLGWMATDQMERNAMWMLAGFTVAVMGMGWWNWRGSLLASVKTTAEYVAVSAERLRRMRQAWRIGWIVLAGQIVMFSVWIWRRLYVVTEASGGSKLFAWGWLLFMTLLAVAFLVWMDGSIRRDTDKFEALKRELL